MLEYRERTAIAAVAGNGRLHGCIGLLALLALLLAQPAWSQATCFWNQNGPGQWDNPANWNGCAGGSGVPAGTPGPADHAVIGNIAPFADVDLGASMRNVDRLTLSAGRIFGSADLTVATRLNWSGGTIEGSVSSNELALGAGSTTDIDGNLHTLTRRRLRIQGTVTWSGGDIELHQDAEIDNQGQLVVDYSSIGSRGSSVPLELRSDGSLFARIHNASTPGAYLEKLGDGLVRFDGSVRFDNGNDVLVTEGTLQINGQGGDFGAYQVAPSARLEFGPLLGVTRTLTGSSAVSGGGAVHKFDEGTLEITGGYLLTGPTEVVDGVLFLDTSANPLSMPNLRVRAPGIFSSPDNLVVTGVLNWEGGEITGTAGGLTLTLPASASATVSLNNLRPAAYLRSRDLINQGSVTLTASANMATHLWLDSASIDNQAGFTIDNNSAANQNLSLDCLSTDCGSFFNRAGASVTLVDQQGIVVIGSQLTAFDNAGLVELTTGCASIGSPGADTGTYRFAGSCTLALSPRPDTERVLQSTVVLDPIGGTSLQLGGSVRVNGASRSFANLIIDPTATLFGPAAIVFTAVTEWRGLIEGTSGSETVTVDPGATLQTNGDPADTPQLFARTLVNNGNLDLRVPLDADGNAQIQNSGMLRLLGTPVVAGAIGCAAMPPCGTLVNAASGTIQSTAAIPGPPTLFGPNFAVANSGVLRVDAGVLQLESAYTAASGSVLDVFPGAGLRRMSGNLVLAAGSLHGAGVIEANVDVDLVDIQPAGSLAGNLGILGNFTASANTTYQMGIAGTLPPAVPKLGERPATPDGVPTYDRLTISGSATLAGTLNVIDLGYSASGSEIFDLLLYASRSGSLIAGANPYSGAGLNLQVEATRTRLAAVAGGGCEWIAGSGDWTNPSNWANCSTGVGPGPGPVGTPGATDTAIIGSGIVNLDVPVSVGGLQFTGGTIQGTSNLSIIDDLIWTGGRFQGASGSLVTTNSTTLVSLLGGQHSIDGRTLVLNGTANWTTGLIELANGGVLEIGSTGILSSNPSLALESIFASGIGAAEVRNGGGIVKLGPNTSGINENVQYSGIGSITVNSGDFIFAASSLAALNGNYSAAAGAALHFVGGNRNFGASATLAGGNLVFGDSSPMPGVNIVDGCIGSSSTVVIRNAELVLNCASPSDLDGLLMTEPLGVLEGSSAIRVTGSFGWGHGTIRGTGLGQTFEIAPAAVAQFDAPLGPSVPRTLSNRRLRNDGTINWIAPNVLEINNGGELSNELGAQLILSGIGPRYVMSNAPAASRLANNGTLSVQSGVQGDIDVAFDNAGSVQLIGGELHVRRNGNDIGSYGILAGSLLYFDGAARTMGPGSVVSGDGEVRAIGGASLVTNGTFQPHDLRIESGSLVQIDSASPQLIQTLLLQNATLTGNAEVRIGTHFDWRNGGVLASAGASPGPVVIQSGALLDLCSGLCTLSNRALRIEGLADWGGGVVEVPMGAAGKITVAAGGTLQTTTFKSAARYRCAAPTCSAEMEIEGSLLQLGDGANLQLTSPLLINGGNLLVDGFGLSAPAITMSAGLIEIRNNADLSASPVILNGGVLRAQGVVNGDVDNIAGRVQPGASPGQITIFGNYTQGPDGILDIEVGGLTPGVDSDFLFVSGGASLNGALNVVNAGFPLSAPATLDILNSDSGLSGTFAPTNIAYPGYTVSYDANTATLTPTGGASLVVNSVSDAGDGICDASECTLRDALIAANLQPDPDVIEFNIPSPQCTGPASACVIVPTSPLPPITGPVLIDGYSQPGASPNTHPQSLGLGSNAVLKVELDGGLTSGSPGLAINAPSAAVVVAGLSIYRFSSAIVAQGPGDANYQILGNFLGLRADGSTAPPGQQVGLSILGGTTQVGDDIGHGMNVISGNDQQGIAILSLPPLASTVVIGNLIGTAPDGLTARGNGLQGIGANTSSAIAGIFIGGNLPDQRNVISGNVQDGIRLHCTATVGNCFNGAQIRGNFIGPAANGNPLGNLGNGVNLSAMDNGLVTIGGPGPGDGNRIAFNAGNGILAGFGGAGRASFLRNDIYINGQLGIDLGGDGRTANDAGDSDTGSNGLLNFPTFTSYTAPGGTSAVIDVILGTPDIGGNYPARVDFYKATEDEPSVWLGTTTCAVPAVTCPASFAFPGGVSVAPGDVVLGIVTDAFGKSSEASFYATTTTVSAPDSTIGTPYLATVEVTSAEPFTALGDVDVDDGLTESCIATLTEVSPGLSSGSCLLNAVAPAGSRTLTATYAPETAPPRPFSNSSGNDTVQITAASAPPVVTQISPTLGPAAGGTLVTITGFNFELGPATISFGAAAGIGASCTSTTQCTVTSPAGSGTARVRVTTADGTSVDTPADDFTYLGAPTLCTNVAPASFYATGTQPRDIALGDFNGDGLRDLAVVNSSASGTVSVFLGVSGGAFAPAVNYGVAPFPRGVAVGDFNGDGNSDLAVANYGSTTVSILLGTGSGTFGGAPSVDAGLGPYSVAVGDFNADGRADLAIALLDADSVGIVRGNGNGTFGPPSLNAGLRSTSIGVGDFDRDGRSDVAVGNQTLNAASVILGNGLGGFGAPASFAVGTSPGDVAIADFNGDGVSDLALPNRSTDNVSVLLGLGNGSFATASNFTVGTQPTAVAAGDFNGDGSIDLAVAQAGINQVALLLGNGSGSFGAATQFAVGSGGSSVAFADFNGDNRADIVVANEFSNSIAVLLNLGCPPTVTSISPTSGPTAGGTVVTLTGTDFDIAATTVNFGATPATAVTCASTVQCTATSPAGSGVVDVIATTAAGSSANTAADDFTYACPPTIVTTGNDSGAGSLRQIIADACAGSTVTFAGGVAAIGLTTGELLISKDLTIDGGAGVSVARLPASPDFRIFRVDAGNTVVLDSLSISNGNIGDDGGGIHNSGNLTVVDSVISGNTSTAGNGGGGIANYATLIVDNTTIAQNSASFAGGGVVQIDGGTATISRSTLSGNSAPQGAAVLLQSVSVNSAMTISNSTISGNSATLTGSGLANFASGAGTSSTLTVTSSTIANNDGPVGAMVTGVNAGAASITLRNNIYAGNSANNVNADAPAVITSLGNNLSDDATGGGGPGDLINTDPLLAPLGNYGGTTQTHALLPGSLAIDAGSSSGAPLTDQRGISRPQLGVQDIGAFESRGFVLSTLSGSPQSAAVNTTFALPLMVAVSANAVGEPVDGGRVAYLAPVSGASATFTSPATVVAAQASVTATANGTVGSYAVTAGANGASGTPSFALTNGVLATTTSIVSIAPTATVVGQPYTVTVAVSDGASPVPVGTVEVRQLSDGALCSVDLASASSCQLVATSALTTAVRASYLGAGAFAASQSAIVPHQVNRADTAIQIVADTPDPSVAGATITVAVALPVVAPGAGVPTGSILVTDGIASCGIALPNLSCDLEAKAVGAATLEARYLGDANFSASVDTEPHTFTADGADLAIIKRNGLRLVPGGVPSTYVLLVTNAGPQSVVNARVTDILPQQFSSASWTCTASGGASCPATGIGTVDTLVSLPVGSTVTFALTATAQATPEQVVTNRATVTPPANAPDPLPANNESVDVDPIGIFGEGFETEDE